MSEAPTPVATSTLEMRRAAADLVDATHAAMMSAAQDLANAMRISNEYAKEVRDLVDDGVLERLEAFSQAHDEYDAAYKIWAGMEAQARSWL